MTPYNEIPSGPFDSGAVAPDSRGSLSAAHPPSFVLGIVGDSGSGKNTVADAVASLLGSERVADLRLDDYHRYTREERAELALTPLNPLVHDLALMREHLRLLRGGRSIRNRTYRHEDGTFGPPRTIEPNDVVLARGLLGFPSQELHDLYDLSVFLKPDPDLLVRWKLRRDVRFRGYSEAEVLKSIASHVLDSKEFVLPQAERADLLIEYELPDWEAPDDSVRTTIRARRRAAEILSERVIERAPVDVTREGGECVVRVPAEVGEAEVDAWAAAAIGDRYVPAAAGVYYDENGEARRRASLAFVEVLIARLCSAMACSRH